MKDRTITLHTFASVKGGVGKSTLATACAKLLAAQKRVPVLVDCDLTGTSIADGLRLKAPRVTLLADGSIDLEAEPTEEWFSVEETRRLRARRRDTKWEKHGPPPPYLNDVLNRVLEGEKPVRVDSVLWQHEKEDGVFYLPSSSVHQDMIDSIAWYNDRDPFEWATCLLWSLDYLTQQNLYITDIVLDLPPGTWGFSHEAMVVVSTLQRGDVLPKGYPPWNEGFTGWETNPFLVTSGDASDLLPALEYIGRRQGNMVHPPKPLANRDTRGLNLVRGLCRELLGPALAAAGLELFIDLVPEISELSKIFKVGDMPLNEDTIKLREVLRLKEAT